MNYLFKLISLCSFIFILASCEDETVVSKSNFELIAGSDPFGKTWQINRIEVELGALIPKTCLTDNFIKYYPNGTYEIGEGLTKCSPNDPQSFSGTWSFNELENELTIQIGDSLQIWDIIKLNSFEHAIYSSFKEGKRTYTLVSTN